MRPPLRWLRGRLACDASSDASSSDASSGSSVLSIGVLNKAVILSYPSKSTTPSCNRRRLSNSSNLSNAASDDVNNSSSPVLSLSHSYPRAVLSLLMTTIVEFEPVGPNKTKRILSK